MTQLITAVNEVLGAPPAGMEGIEYLVAGALLVVLCMSAVSMISGIFRYIGGI